MRRPAHRLDPPDLHRRLGQRSVRRREPAVLKRVVLITAAVVLFLAVSFLLARFLSTENTERDAELALIQAQARADVPGMLALLQGCRERPACVAAVRANASNPRLRRAGAVKILSIKSSTSYSLSSATGKTRLAWTVVGQLPVVQCIEVRRAGNFLAGMTVDLLSLSAPIPNEADC
ncbi:MAG TPA: hypothetical protein VHY83_15440 [Solirubrobacteraceae bacterium]|jgi:hypothetical protein|nr:hypothetical protein [Solirubrobacteraceae bacterium]